jgi:hypothetical protein
LSTARGRRTRRGTARMIPKAHHHEGARRRQFYFMHRKRLYYKYSSRHHQRPYVECVAYAHFAKVDIFLSLFLRPSFYCHK